MGKPGFPIPLPVEGAAFPTPPADGGAEKPCFPHIAPRRDEHPMLPGKAGLSHTLLQAGVRRNPVSPPPAPGDTGADDGQARAGPRGHSPAVSGAVPAARCSGSSVATRRGIIPQTRLSLSTPPACAKIRAATRRRARDQKNFDCDSACETFSAGAVDGARAGWVGVIEPQGCDLFRSRAEMVDE